MKPIDRWLQRWRIARALPFVRTGDRLLDIGCYDRTLIDRVLPRIDRAVGIDLEATPASDDRVDILSGAFPGAHRFEDAAFDCITMLAVLEHVEDPEALARECARILAPGGRLIVTVPHPFVDVLLDGMMALRLIDGMATEEHHGFDVGRTRAIFEAAGLSLVRDRRFQLGLNRLFVFERPVSAARSD